MDEIVTAKAAFDPLLFNPRFGRAVELRLNREILDLLQPSHPIEIEHRWTAECIEQIDDKPLFVERPWAIDLDIPEGCKALTVRASTTWTPEP